MGALQRLDGDVDVLGTQVAAVQGDVTALRGEFRAMAAELGDVSHTIGRVESSVGQLGRTLDEFRDRYAKDQARARAEAELTRLTTEWHARFEQRRQTRALAHGLVHALTKDALEKGMVDKDLVAACAQERMLMDRGFWLGPAVVALAARHLDKEPQMHRARAQAYSIDQARANLFFTLTCTRLGELGEAARWMDRYLQSLDPYALDEDFHVVLDAVACNELGAQAHAYTRQAMRQWLSRLDLTQATTLETQVARHMGDLGKVLPKQRYQELSNLCADNWGVLRSGWEWATVPKATLAHLRRAFPGDLDDAPAGHADSALDALIDRHDADEAQLASRIRYLELVVEHGGDEETARQEHTAQRNAARPVNLRTLLVNAVFMPEAVRLGEEARLLALRAVWPHVLNSSEAYAQRSRSLLPRQIDVSWGEWSRPLPADPTVAVPTQQLVDEVRELIAERTHQEVESVQLNRFRFLGAAVVTVVSTIMAFLLPQGAPRVIAATLATAAVVLVITEWRRVPARKQELSREGQDSAQTATAVLNRALTQRVTFFTAWHENLDVSPQLATWANQAWRSEAGALEGDPRGASGDKRENE
ncbi:MULTISPECIES: hypothetical protein [Streptomyces]|uniref:hypothetical protein n=1 Tax=Streptomyces TaxID=1883 RepID=UPI001E3B9850|nr:MULTISPECIES: hypothetical protein [Streptomyces]UFQ17782.1 hypothetical protein J2N69_23820 [Streptomyces huasconensis]WCL87388.1 hypothetical protein PPN52_23820 [Streptomyces sp. JCM 35825]